MPTKKTIKRFESERELKERERDDEIMPLIPKQANRAYKPVAPLGEEPILEELTTLGFTEEGAETPDDGDRLRPED
jgi:hypothetical protein